MSADLLKKMREMGLSMDQAIELMETWEAGAAKPVPSLTPGAIRTRKWREKKDAAHHGDITVTHHGDATPLEQSVSPTPPSQTQTPLPPKTPLKGVKKVPSRRCPDSWQPKMATIATLRNEGFEPGELERALTRMRDHEFRTARSDWDATFRNWVRTDRDRAPRQAHERPDADPKYRARMANYANAAEGFARLAEENRQRRGDGREPDPLGEGWDA